MADLDARFRSPLTRFFRLRTRDVSEAEDLTQEVFVRLLRREGATTPDNTDAFVFTIAANLLRDRSRRVAVRGSQVSPEAEAEQGRAVHPALVEEIDPQRVLTSKEALRRALVALNELPTRTQDAFVLRRIEGMTTRDTAKALGLSVSAVEKHLARAIAHLAQSLQDQ
jgi:RNA polymerase sigma-70 factor (ECF subfamily)